MKEQRTRLAEDDGRGESDFQRLDRNWHELLQELRVLQTGIQILVGFLLTLPFQARFPELDRFQVAVYLVLVILAALITVLLLATVVMHRTFFQLHIKDALVRNSDRILRIAMILVGMILMGTVGLIFDIVLGRAAGTITALALASTVVGLWVVLPLLLRRRNVDRAR